MSDRMSPEKLTERSPDRTGDSLKQAARRKLIVEAALECFLQYGVAKTSLDDIAKRAKLSRPLLYLLFRNKEEVFIETLRTMYKHDVDRARPVLDEAISDREKLIRIYEELIVKPWARITKHPSGEEFVEQCHKYFPQLDEEYEREVLKLLLPLLKEKETVQLFMLCIDGLYSDNPSVPTLRKRVRLLAERFV